MNMVNRGRKLVIMIVALSIIINISTVAYATYIYVDGGRMDLASSELQRGTIRFILTVILMYFLYKGYVWAKWICIVLYLPAGMFSLLFQFIIFSLSMLIMGGLYFYFAVLLITSKEIKAFFQFNKGIYPSDIEESD